MDDQKASTSVDPEKKKGLFKKLEEITPDKEEQVALIGVAVRLGIVVWSGFMLLLFLAICCTLLALTGTRCLLVC